MGTYRMRFLWADEIDADRAHYERLLARWGSDEAIDDMEHAFGSIFWQMPERVPCVVTLDCATTIVMSGWRQLGWPVCDCREGAAIGKRQLAATITPVLPRRPWRQWREPSGGGSFRH